VTDTEKKAEEVLNDAIEYGIREKALEETRRWMKLKGAAKTDYEEVKNAG